MIPTDLSGCTVWLDASQLTGADGSSIGTQWSDLSGNGNHGAVVGSPAPVVKTNALAGKRVVRFTVNEGRVRGGGMYPAATPNSSFTAIFVGRQWGTYIGRIFSNVLDPYNFLVGTHVSGRNSCYDAGWINAGVAWDTPPTPWTIWGFVYTGSPNLGTFFVDGVDSGSGSGGGAHDHRWALSGWHATGEQETCDVEVAELITYNRALTPTERIQVEDYLDAKWINPPTSFPVPASFHTTGQLQIDITEVEPPPDGGEGDGGSHPWVTEPRTPVPHVPVPSWGGVATVAHKKLGGWHAKLDRVGQLIGVGTLSAAISPKLKIDAALETEGALTPALLLRNWRTAELSTVPTLYSDPQPYRTVQIATAFSSGGALGFVMDDGFSASLNKGALAQFSSGGGLTSDISGGVLLIEGLSATVIARYLIPVPFSSTAQLVATVDRLQAGLADLTASGVLSATVSPVITVLANLTASGALTAQAAGGITVLANLLGTGTLSAQAVTRYLTSLGISGAGALTALIKESYTAAPESSAVGAISAAIYARYLVAMGLAGAGTLSALLSQIYALDAPTTTAGVLTAAAFPSFLCSAGTSASGSLSATAINPFTPFNETNQPWTNQTRPVGTSGCWVTLIGAGGGGGTGHGGAFQNAGAGGGGGGAGTISRSFIPVANLGSTYSVVRPTGSTAAGAATSFTSGSVSLSANGGGKGGNGGVGVHGAGGSAGTTTVSGATVSTINGAAGAAAAAGTGGTAANQTTACPGGGAGGFRNSVGSMFAGGKGGNSSFATGGNGGGTTGGAGSPGGDASPLAGNPGAGAGGGGGANGTGGTGGAAGDYGAGGGGGGGGNNASTAGAGGDGYSLIEWV